MKSLLSERPTDVSKDSEAPERSRHRFAKSALKPLGSFTKDPTQPQEFSNAIRKKAE